MRFFALCFITLLHCCFGQMSSDFACDDGRTTIPSNLVCTETGQCPDCSDERNCSHNIQFMSCGSGPPYCYKEEQHCNGILDCENCRDESNCPNRSTTFFTCDDEQGCVDFFFGLDKCIRPDRHSCPYFCDGFQHCSDGSDEKSEGFGFKCVTTGTGSANSRTSSCVIPQRYLGRPKSEPSICRNGADQCFVNNDTKVFNESMCWTCLDGTIIQRQQVCDKVFDCRDLSDECLCFRDDSDNSLCEPFLKNTNCKGVQVSCPHENKCINVTQICDGKKDCETGDDEGHCSRYTERECETSYGNEFSCDESPLVDKQVPIACNGFPECLNAEDECRANCSGKLPEYCDIIARRSSFDSFDGLLFCGNLSKPINVIQLCNKIVDCPNEFDEKDCYGLSFCSSGNKSVPYDRRECGIDRCNLEAVCDNLKDELNCSSATHFYCDGFTRFIPQWLRYDGTFDCDDFSDECDIFNRSVSSRTDLIGSPGLRVWLWLLMLLSLIGNGIVISKTLIELYNALRRRLHCTINRVGVCNKIMIVNLAVADFLMGVYLLIIAIKSVEFSGVYCMKQNAWLTSVQCEHAGLLAVLSSQTSVFLMVLMTSYRLYGIANPFSAERIRGRIIYLATLVIWVLSFSIAIIPLIPAWEEIFVSGIVVNQPYGYNILTMQDLSNSLISNANRLPGFRDKIPNAIALNVNTFCNIFDKNSSLPSYCRDTNLLRNTVSYYASDGVCLPRYYASVDEPASVYSIAIVCINFAAFLYMFVAYVFIYRSTSLDVQQGGHSSGSVDENRSKEDHALSLKIARLIFTDFICWIPICVMAFISFAKIPLPDMVYPVTAIVLIPINSATNPWLYSSFLTEYIKRLYRYIKRVSHRRRKINSHGNNSTIRSRHIRFRRYRRKSSMESSMTFSVRLSTTGAASADHSGAASQNLHQHAHTHEQ